MHPVCLMSKPLLPCFVTIVLLIVSCTQLSCHPGWYGIAIKRPPEPSTSEVLESAHALSCFQSLNKLEQFFPTNCLMMLLLLFCFSTISFGFFWGLLSIWRLQPGVNCDPHQNVQSAKQLDDPVVKTVLDALNSNTCWTLEKRRCLVVEDLCPFNLGSSQIQFVFFLGWVR